MQNFQNVSFGWTVQFLWHVIDRDEILVDPTKVEVVINWEHPKILMEVRSFVGLEGYYRRFIYDFSKIATSLNNMPRNTIKFECTKKCEESFRELKKRLSRAPVLSLLDDMGNLVVYSDVLPKGQGCVLIQNG